MKNRDGKRKKTLKNSSLVKKNIASKSFKGAISGLIITVLSVLVFAIIIKETNAEDSTISAVNQIIKIVSIFVSAVIASKDVEEGKILSGMLAGVIYVLLGFITFSIIDGGIGDLLLLLADLAMSIVIGMLVAMIFGKLKKGKYNKTGKIKRV